MADNAFISGKSIDLIAELLDRPLLECGDFAGDVSTTTVLLQLLAAPILITETTATVTMEVWSWEKLYKSRMLDLRPAGRNLNFKNPNLYQIVFGNFSLSRSQHIFYRIVYKKTMGPNRQGVTPNYYFSPCPLYRPQLVVPNCQTGPNFRDFFSSFDFRRL